MLMCLDVGNTHIYAGIFIDDELRLQFRYPSKEPLTSDIFGLFLKGVLRENRLDPAHITAICMGSVVPSIDYSIRAACLKYFSLNPLELKAGVKTGLNIQVKQPARVGSDRIATATAAVDRYPGQHMIVVDFGTATTVCAISKDKEYLGGAILPGMQTSLDALCQATSQLMPVKITKPESALGKTTEVNIQSGLYYSQLGGVQALIDSYQQRAFKGESAVVIATGGYAYLFAGESLYDEVVSDLVLHGLRLIWQKNAEIVGQN